MSEKRKKMNIEVTLSQAKWLKTTSKARTRAEKRFVPMRVVLRDALAKVMKEKR